MKWRMKWIRKWVNRVTKQISFEKKTLVERQIIGGLWCFVHILAEGEAGLCDMRFTSEG